jgi:hypothetical protein
MPSETGKMYCREEKNKEWEWLDFSITSKVNTFSFRNYVEVLKCQETCVSDVHLGFDI